MGTRHLVMIVLNDQMKVAQYGQWDGYPSGCGVSVLDFLHRMPKDFKKQVRKVRNMSPTLLNKVAMQEFNVPVKSLSSAQNSELLKKYPYWSRDVSHGILDVIAENPNDKIYLQNMKNFAGESLHCEWGYVIDLDNNIFEVHEGYNTKPLDDIERFYHLQKEKTEFKPIRLRKQYSLLELPTKEEFLEYFDDGDSN